MACLVAQPICIIRGTSQTFRITVFDEANARVDLTGSTLYFTVALTAGGAAEISKISTTPTEILILAQTGATLGQADIFLVPTDTTSLPLGLHVYDVWLELVTGERHVIVGPDEFRIEVGVTVIP